MEYRKELGRYKENNCDLTHKEAVENFKLIWMNMKDNELKELSEDISKAVINKEMEYTEEVVEEVVVSDKRQEAIDFYYEKINGRTMFNKTTMNEFFTHWRNITGTKTIGACSTCSNNFTKMVKIFKKKLGV